jgi:hypothetical protein
VRLGEAHICPAILEFLILFLSRSSWAFVLWEAFLHGLAIGTPSPWSGIDKFLVSLEWETQLLDSLQKRLSRLCSDHFPILLDCGGIAGTERYFKFIFILPVAKI